MKPSLKRETYIGALFFNVLAFVPPALYGTLSKLWVANIESAMVVTTDSYTYIGVIAEVLNEGLSRAAYLVIGDKSSRTPRSQVQLIHTLIPFQSILGLIMSVAFVGGAATFASGFVPIEVRDTSLTYVRISAFSVNTSPWIDRIFISSVKFIINIILDLILISKIYVRGITPIVNMQAGIQLACNIVSAIAGLVYFLTNTKRSITRFVEHVTLSTRSCRSCPPRCAILHRIRRTECAVSLARPQYRHDGQRLCNGLGYLLHHPLGPRLGACHSS